MDLSRAREEYQLIEKALKEAKELYTVLRELKEVTRDEDIASVLRSLDQAEQVLSIKREELISKVMQHILREKAIELLGGGGE